MSMSISFLAVLGAVHVKAAHPASVGCADVFWFVADTDPHHTEIHGQDGSPAACQASCQVDPHCVYWTYMEALPWDEEVSPFLDGNERGCLLIPDNAFNVTEEDVLPEDHVYVESGPRYCDEELDEYELNPHPEVKEALSELIEKRDRHENVRRRLGRKQRPCWFGRRCQKKKTPRPVALPVQKPVSHPASKPVSHPAPKPTSHPVASPALFGNMFYYLKTDELKSNLRSVFINTEVAPWLLQNGYVFSIETPQGRATMTYDDLSGTGWTFTQLREMFAMTPVQFTNAVLLQKETGYGAGKENPRLQSKVDDLKARVEAAEAAQAEAETLTSLPDEEFDAAFEALKTKHGFELGEFELPGGSHAERREAALGSLKQFQEEMTKSLQQAEEALALNEDPELKVLKLAQNTFVKGVTIESISPVIPRRASDTFINEYFSEEMRKSVHSNFHSEKSVNAAAMSAKGGGLLAFGPVGGSAKASGKFQWHSQVNTQNVRNSQLRTCSVSKFHVSQIYNFKIENISLDQEVLVEALELGKTQNSADPVVKQWANARAKDFLDKWPLSVFMGPFGVGGYYTVSATTTSASSVSSTKLISLAQEKAQLAFSMGVSLMSGFSYLNVGVSAERQKEKQNVNKFSSLIDNVHVSTHIESHTRGPPVTSPKDVENMLSVLPDTWVLFPEVSEENFEWKSISDMITDHAEVADAPTRAHYASALALLTQVQSSRDEMMKACVRGDCFMAKIQADIRKTPPKFGFEAAYEKIRVD